MKNTNFKIICILITQPSRKTTLLQIDTWILTGQQVQKQYRIYIMNIVMYLQELTLSRYIFFAGHRGAKAYQVPTRHIVYAPQEPFRKELKGLQE